METTDAAISEVIAKSDPTIDPAATVHQNGAIGDQLPPVPLKAGAIVEFTPPSAPKSRVYKVRVPSISDRAALQRHVSIICGDYPSDALYLNALRRVYRDSTTVLDDQRPEILDFIDGIRPVVLGHEPRDGHGADFERLTELQSRATRLDRGFAELASARSFYLTMMPVITLQHFLIDWLDGPCAMERTKSLVAESAIAAIPTQERLELGTFALGLMGATEVFAKN